jgi:hypothetical protein
VSWIRSNAPEAFEHAVQSMGDQRSRQMPLMPSGHGS